MNTAEQQDTDQVIDEGQTTPESAPEAAEAGSQTQEQSQEQRQEPDAATKAINRKHWQAKQAERERDAANARADAAERRLAEATREPAPTEIAAPDPLDDNFDTQNQAYVDSIRQKAAYDAQQDVERQREQERQQQYQAEQQRRANEQEQEYTKSITAMGLEVQTVNNAIYSLAENGVPPEIGAKLMEDEQSPLIIAWLAEGQNIDELAPMLEMTPHQQSIYVGTQLREKASVLKPKPTGAPPPADTLSGGTAGETPDPLLEGATFE